MCGIAGVVGFADFHAATFAVRQMTDALARRGPDGEGITVCGDAVLGHRRLAVYDLTQAGAQPMRSSDGSVAVVFNGAIYNFRSLRKELIREGFSFSSQTDTEVLVHGYRAWGIDGLVNRLHGMFAFGLWDAQLHKLYLVRDRLGVKPVLYALRDGAIAFASTTAALKAAGFGADIDEIAITDFLRWGFVSDDQCIYKGIVKVSAATIVEWSQGNVQQRLYWKPPSPDVSSRESFSTAVAQTERLLLDSVSIRLDADVPVGVLLSGGIDSSLVCWAVKKLGADITAYTVGVPGDPWDETAAAKQTAERLKIRHSVLEMSPADPLELNEVVTAYGEPFASASALAMLRVSRTIAKSAKVLLTGDGGDDLFLGYPRHRHLWLADKVSARVPSGLSPIFSSGARLLPQLGPLRRAAAFMDYVAEGVPAYLGKSAALAGYHERDLLGPRLHGRLHNGVNIVASLGGECRLEKFMDYERKSRFVGEYLTKIDGATMHYGLEARSPFLDQKLWEFGSALPLDLRLRHGRLKAILREVARRRIGKSMARRAKRGFGVPVQRWLADRWFPRAEQALQNSVLEKEGWINARQALAELRQSVSRGWAPAELWYIFVFETWIAQQKRPTASLET